MQVYTVKILFPPSFGQKATDKCNCVVAKSKTCSRKEISPNKIRTKKLLPYRQYPYIKAKSNKGCINEQPPHSLEILLFLNQGCMRGFFYCGRGPADKSLPAGQ